MDLYVCVSVHFVCCVFRCEWGGGRAGEAPRVADSRPARQVGTLNTPPLARQFNAPLLPFAVFHYPRVLYAEGSELRAKQAAVRT